MKDIKKQINRIKHSLGSKYKQKNIPTIVITIILLLILIFIPLVVTKKINLFSNASTINSVYPSGGTLSGNASVASDPNAPGGNYVVLGTAPTPTPTRAPVAQMVQNTKEINYYPAAHGWDSQWFDFNSSVVDTDFGKIQSLGFNTVRIVLQADSGAFDYPQPTTAELNNLAQVISLAANHNLKVHLTLYDYWSSYTDISGSKEWANAVIKPYAGDSRISMIEVKNEVDQGYAAEMSWTETMLPYIQSISGGIPVTVSVTGGDSNLQSVYTQLASASAMPDFWDFHNYEYDGLLYSTLSQAKTIVNNQPLFIGETGYTTYAGASDFHYANSAENTANEEAEQEYFFRQFDYVAEALNLPVASPWIYSDFTSTANPSNPDLGADQFYSGIYRTDGSAKASAATLQSINGGNAIDTSFNNSFEQSDGSLPTVWMLWQNPSLGYSANFAWDDTVAHTGTASARISNSTQSPNGIAGYYLNPVQYVKPNQQYTLSVWAKGLNATGDNFISIGWFNSNHTYISQSSSADLPTGTTNWQQLSVTATAPSNAAAMELHLNSQGNTGSVWYDDVGFTAP